MVGVNNTIYVVNEDPSNLGHVIQSVSWPTGGQVFGAFDILPGQNVSFTLTTPGVYHYQCTWHPVWMEGTITVVA
ncbi:MAG: plastocyanin/azurin family copper-binding protein [Thaumarchaeota archaeon]|nr:plastocyanin/azurin family copper-binding protein [Nitrososphaerota archaeon]